MQFLVNILKCFVRALCVSEFDRPRARSGYELGDALCHSLCDVAGSGPFKSMNDFIGSALSALGVERVDEAARRAVLYVMRALRRALTVVFAIYCSAQRSRVRSVFVLVGLQRRSSRIHSFFRSTRDRVTA